LKYFIPYNYISKLFLYASIIGWC